MLMKLILKDLNQQRDMKYSCIERLNIVKMSVFLKLICKFRAFPVKIPARFFCTHRLSLKLTHRPWNRYNNLDKEE